MQMVSATEGCRLYPHSHALFACHGMLLQGFELPPCPFMEYQQVSQDRWGPFVKTARGPDLVKLLNTCLRDLLIWMLHSPLAPSMSSGSLTVWLCKCFRMLLPSKAGPPLLYSIRSGAGVLALPRQVGLFPINLWWEMSWLPHAHPRRQEHMGPQCIVLSCQQSRRVWSPAFCLPRACQWHCSPGGDHPSHGLHSSAVTPCSEQAHVADGPLQGCAFFWWQ